MVEFRDVVKKYAGTDEALGVPAGTVGGIPVVTPDDLGPAAAMTPAEVVEDPDAQAALSATFVQVVTTGDPTGVVDSVTALQAVVDAVETAGGGDVVLRRGTTYLVTDHLVIPAGVRLLAHGATIKPSSTFHTTATAVQTSIRGGGTDGQFRTPVLVNGGAVEGLTVDGSNLGSTAFNVAGILVHNADTVTIRDCSAHTFIPQGWSMNGTMRQFGVCVADSTRTRIFGGYYADCGYENVAVRDETSDTIVIGVVAEDGEVHAAQATGTNCTGVSFVGCVFSNTGPAVYDSSALMLHSCTHVTVSGCQIEGRLGVTDGEAVMITGNRVNRAAAGAIQVRSLDATAQRVFIIGNSVTSAGDGAIYVQGGKHVVIEGNDLVGLNAGVVTDSVQACQDVQIARNTISSGTRGVTILGPAGTAQYGIQITDNIIRGASNDMFRIAGNTQRAVIRGNRSEVATTYGVVMAGTSAGALIEGNDFSLVSTPGGEVISVGDDLVRGNRGLAREDVLALNPSGVEYLLSVDGSGNVVATAR